MKNANLAAICDVVGLTPCIVLSPAAGGQSYSNLKATTVEAVLAAVFKDSDFETCESVMARWGLTLDPSDALVMFTWTPPPPAWLSTGHMMSINLEYCTSSSSCVRLKPPRVPLAGWPSLGSRKGFRPGDGMSGSLHLNPCGTLDDTSEEVAVLTGV